MSMDNPTIPDVDDDDDALVFHETRKTRRVKIVNDDTRAARYYVLKEMMSDGVERWMKFQATRVKTNRRGVPDMNDANFKDYVCTLIGMCLFYVDGDDEGKPVPIETIRRWPASTLNGLYEACETMNALNDEGKEQAKKA